MREIEIQATISRSLYREMVYFQMFRRKRTTLPFGIVAYLLAAGTVIAKLTGYYTVDSYASTTASYSMKTVSRPMWARRRANSPGNRCWKPMN